MAKKKASTQRIQAAPLNPEVVAIIEATTKEAAQIALTLAPLIATPEQHRIPEESLVEGTKKRWEFIFRCLTPFLPIPIDKETMFKLLSNEGTYGHERMCSAWWSSLRVFNLQGSTPDILNTSALDMIASGYMHSDAKATFDSSPDPRIREKQESARKELTLLMEEIQEEANK